MTRTQPNETIDARYSSEDAAATPWNEARRQLEEAGVYWISTVRPDGRPHVTTLLAVLVDDALYFCTGAEERRRRTSRRTRIAFSRPAATRSTRDSTSSSRATR